MKKIVSLILVISALFALAACDIAGDPATTAANATLPPSETELQTEEEVIIKPNSGSIVLNEAMASNSNVITDNYGEYSDWIELYNDSDAPVSLKNYMLSDNPLKPTKFVFPDITLGAHEYLLVWATGRNLFDEQNNAIHLPFKLSKKGEIICLFNSLGSEVGRITYYDMPTDISAGPDEKGKTVFYAEPTPGEKNVQAQYVAPETEEPPVPVNSGDKTVNTLRINEFATKKSITFTDSEGDYGAWVEIYNFGQEEVSLSGLYLSDDAAKPQKWAFPDAKIAAGAYFTVFMMSKDKEYDGKEMQATFTLSGKEEKLAIYNGKAEEIDSCAVYELVSNITCGRDSADPEHWLFYPKATPNAENTVKGFEDIESARYPSYKTTYISEVVAVNATLDASPDGKTYSSGELYDYYDTYDYIELKNPTDKDIDLSTLYIGKGSFENATQLPTAIFKAGKYRIIYFADENKYDTKKDEIYLDISLKRYGNELYLYDAQGTVIDYVAVGTLFDNTSAGRISDQDDNVYYFTDVTPGAKNSTTAYGKSIAAPKFDIDGGYVEAGTKLTIKAPANAVVYYTTDGSSPTKNSKLYTDPVVITETVSIRARAYKSDSLPSEEVSVSFIVGRKHKMPVIFLNGNYDDLFSYKTGILANGPFDPESTKYTDANDSEFFNDASKTANFWKDWERPINFNYIDENGEQILSFNAGAKVFGQYSRVHDQKSISIRLKDKYGPTKVVYPFFGDDYINVFSSLVLRGSGQDANRSHIRDAFIAVALNGKINCFVMNYRPVVVYLNGEYYGIYDLRERISDDFVADHTGADPDNLDRIKGLSIVQSGTYDNYKALFKYVTSNDLSKSEHYDYVCSQIDLDNFIDYWIVTTYFANSDPGNIKFFRERKEGAKWQWIPYDFDWSIQSTDNRFDIVLTSSKQVYSFIKAMMKNSSFKEKFLRRYAVLLKDTLNPDRLLPLLRQLTDEIAEEMEYHIAKWRFRYDSTHELRSLLASCPSSMRTWETHIQNCEKWLRERDTDIIKQLLGYKGLKLTKDQLRSYGFNINW